MNVADYSFYDPGTTRNRTWTFVIGNQPDCATPSTRAESDSRALAFTKFPFGVPHAHAAGKLGDKPLESCDTRFLLVRAVFYRAVPHRSQRKYLGSDESHLRSIFVWGNPGNPVISRAAWQELDNARHAANAALPLVGQE